MAVAEVLDVEQRWFADVEPAAIATHAHHWPGLVNLGDITTAAWSSAEPVDIMTAGYPCQPFSLAGQRMGADDSRHLWPHVAAAVRHLRPGLVILENVAGHRSKGFGAVLADLAALGYRTAWGSVRASDVGAPHARERVFVAATDARHGCVPEWARCARGKVGQRQAVGEDVARCGQVPSGGLTLLPTPAARDYRSGRSHLIGQNARPLNEIAVMRLTGDGDPWREFGPAVRHWERLSGRLAPAPAVQGARGARVLNPALPEWMMGLPLGFVTAVPGLTRTDQIKLLGNGVCPPQGAWAVRALLSILVPRRCPSCTLTH
jgi:DNA (cytosine-5)-methyltransferase 1